MSEEFLRLIYPLGFLSAAAFGLRFIIQWLYSESKGESVVVRPFWWLSLLGNITLWLHATLQLQFHVAIMQMVNGVIAWRNLDLMKKGPHAPFWAAFILMGLFGSFTVFLFTLPETIVWFRLPTSNAEIAPFWHMLGFSGILLFNSRFLIQWWEAETLKKSTLGPLFWWMSVSGGSLSIIYFAYIADPVNLIGPSLGMIPYIRNLMLIYKKRVAT